MILIINKTNYEKYAGYMEEYHKIRKREYIDRWGWNELENMVRPDLEIDQYDKKELCTYILCISDDLKVKGGVRLISTLFNTLTTEYFADLITLGDIPESANIWEISRFFETDKEWKGPHGYAKTELAIAMFELALENDVSKFVGTYHSTLLKHVMEVAPWKIEILGIPQSESEPYIPANIYIDEKMLAFTKAVTGFRGSMLNHPDNIVKQKPSSFRPDEIYDQALDVRLELLPDNVTEKQYLTNLADIYKQFGGMMIN
jgi:N-acyl-L-homoserine lactone synthetase